MFEAFCQKAVVLVNQSKLLKCWATECVNTEHFLSQIIGIDQIYEFGNSPINIKQLVTRELQELKTEPLSTSHSVGELDMSGSGL